MTVNLSIKNVPDDVAERLRRRAGLNHRSLQRELLALVEQAAGLAGAPSLPLSAGEPEARYVVQAPPLGEDGLLAELDSIVAGSRWGDAALLSRDQLHDRALAREIDFDARKAERGDGA